MDAGSPGWERNGERMPEHVVRAEMAANGVTLDGQTPRPPVKVCTPRPPRMCRRCRTVHTLRRCPACPPAPRPAPKPPWRE